MGGVVQIGHVWGGHRETLTWVETLGRRQVPPPASHCSVEGGEDQGHRGCSFHSPGNSAVPVVPSPPPAPSLPSG